jgi:hypothetical protein
MRGWRLMVGAIAALSLTVAVAGAATVHPRVNATSVPTLGLHQKLTEGFGHVRPRDISYGGDPTSIVGRVRWSSWGGAHAIGHGTADWVWPGWCVACGSVQLPATVVAFGLRSCGGHPAYTHVEWYFPSRGMSFSPSLSSENICNPRASVHVKPPPQAHCALVRVPGELVTKIEVIGAGVGCPDARALVAKLDLVHYFRHNARFHVGPWWCGSELIMQLSKSGPQSFECQSGNYTDLSFDVMPTADVIRG